MTQHTITEDEFRTRFRPQEGDDTGGFVNYWPTTPGHEALMQQADAERRLWTWCGTAGGNTAIVQGWAFVNREFYIICDVPVPDGEDYTIRCEALYCEDCGERFSDISHPDDPDVVERADPDDDYCDCCVTCRTTTA